MNESPDSKKRQFLGMHFKCCSVYTRIYLNKNRTAFAGHCPKCAKPTRIRVTKSGGKNRFFEAS